MRWSFSFYAVRRTDGGERKLMERTHMNKSLTLDSETSHIILDNALDAHILMDREGTIVGWNPQSERIFGWSADEVLGRRLSDLVIPPAYRDAHERGLQTFLATGKGAVLGTRIEIEGWHRDQRQFPIELTVIPVERKGSCVFSAFVRDITERKQAEMSLKEAKDQAERDAQERAGILAAVDVFFIYVDCHGRVTEWTIRAEQTFGISWNQALGKLLRELPISWNWDEVAGLMQCPGGQTRFRLHQGERGEQFIGMTVTPITQEQGTGHIFMGKDITDQLKIDHEIAQSQKLESIGQLAAGVAHEINTPIQFVGDNIMFLNDSFIGVLRALRQYQCLLEAVKTNTCSLALIESCEVTNDQADLEYLLSEIPVAILQSSEGVSRVSTIVRAMKEFAHPGSNEKAEVNLNNAIMSTLTVASNEWKYVADLQTHLDPSLPPVPCLIGEFNQVVLNIIVNAAHAIADVVKDTTRKGTITVSTTCVGDQAEIRIADTGSGIPESICTKIFDPFFTTKEVGKGTGQGLAIARSVVVNKHGGSITVESEVGRGTTFVIRLPLKVPSSAIADQVLQ